MSEVRVEKMMFGCGHGYGRLDGKACFVSFGAPGDLAEVAVTASKKSYSEARIRQILEESPDRVFPPCPIFGQCGGCTWQHLSYAAQLREKESLFRDALWRTARIPAETVSPIVPSVPWRYRSRVQLKVHKGPDRIHVGFYRSGSHFVIDLPGECLLAAPAVQKAIGEVRDLLPSFPDPERLPQIDIACGEESGGVIIFHYIGNKEERVADFLRDAAARFTTVDGVYIQSGRKSSLLHVSGSAGYTYGLPRPEGHGVDFRFDVSAAGFSQVNLAQNRNLAKILIDLGELCISDRVLDLYCGNGNLSLPLAASAKEVVGIEAYAPSIADAVRNAYANEVANASFLAADAAAGIDAATAGGRCFEVVVLDPPRAGAADALPLIARIAPEKIVYVSCDPMTLARDLAWLMKNGYGVRRSVPVDMFPQTYHMESVTLLTRI